MIHVLPTIQTIHQIISSAAATSNEPDLEGMGPARLQVGPQSFAKVVRRERFLSTCALRRAGDDACIVATVSIDDNNEDCCCMVCKIINSMDWTLLKQAESARCNFRIRTLQSFSWLSGLVRRLPSCSEPRHQTSGRPDTVLLCSNSSYLRPALILHTLSHRKHGTRKQSKWMLLLLHAWLARSCIEQPAGHACTWPEIGADLGYNHQLAAANANAGGNTGGGAAPPPPSQSSYPGQQQQAPGSSYPGQPQAGAQPQGGSSYPGQQQQQQVRREELSDKVCDDADPSISHQSICNYVLLGPFYITTLSDVSRMPRFLLGPAILLVLLREQYGAPSGPPPSGARPPSYGQPSGPPPGSPYGQAPGGYAPPPGAPAQSQYGQSQYGQQGGQQQQGQQPQYGQPASNQYGGQQSYGAPPGAPPKQGQGQGQYGQPAAAPPSGGSGGNNDPRYIQSILQQCVQEQRIQAFYPPGSLEPLAQRVAQTGVLDRIATEWRVRIGFLI